MNMNNNLISDAILSLDLDLGNITDKEFKEAISFLIDETKKEHEKMCSLEPTYDVLFETFKSGDKLSKCYGLLRSLVSMTGNDEYRKVFEEVSPPVIGLFSELSLDIRYFNLLKSLKSGQSFNNLSQEQKKVVELNIKDLEKFGVHLEKDKKDELTKINQEISSLRQKFEANISDYYSSLGFEIKESDLSGLSERTIENSKFLAQQKKIDGYWLDYNSGLYTEVLQTSDVEGIRKRIYDEINRTGLDEKFNNYVIIDDIYKKLQQKAEILGYKNYAEFSLSDNMAQSPENVREFINKLGDTAMPFARKEKQLVRDFGRTVLNKDMNFWDYPYINKKYENQFFSFNQEELRKFFPVEHVLNSGLDFLSELFDLEFKKVEKNTWDKDVIFFEIIDDNKKEVIGTVYVDLYMRDGKMAGAWLDPVVSRHCDPSGKVINPVSFLVCNAPKDATGVATFELEEVVTLFHELGHFLHHTLTKVNTNFLSGINKVQHDAVEFPSQLLENFVYNKDFLKKITKHVETGHALPDQDIENILRHKTFLGASTVVAYVQFSEMDLDLYLQKEKHPVEVELKSKEKWKVLDETDMSAIRMPRFSHIFGGGYEAGYYAYQWAEVMSHDGFNLFAGVLGDKESRKSIADLYRIHVLETGGLFDMRENFEKFTGRREPDMSYLLSSYVVKEKKNVSKMRVG